MQDRFRWGFVLGGCTNICGAILHTRLIGWALNFPILSFKLSNYALKLESLTLVGNILWNKRFIAANGDSCRFCCELTVWLFSYSANISRISEETLLRFWRWCVTFELDRIFFFTVCIICISLHFADTFGRRLQVCFQNSCHYMTISDTVVIPGLASN
jgi:bacteriorhodopsin